MEDKYTVVTGSSQGIGAAIAKELAKRGRHIILTARSEERLKATCDEIKNRYDVHQHTDIFCTLNKINK